MTGTLDHTTTASTAGPAAADLRAARPTGSHPAPLRADDDAFVGLAAEIGAVATEHAADHDRDATFVAEAYAAMRDAGYLRLAVPTELGGLGATMRQVCYAQAELARYDGAAALAAAMHGYNVLVQVFRWRMGAPDAEGVLRRVADEGIVIATSGGSDWLWPTTVATPTEDGTGYRVSGRKVFCSQAPGATVIGTCAVVGEPGAGGEVLHFSVPLAAEGVTIEETWDTLGMRGTASHDVIIDDVLVPAERIAGKRPYGERGGPLNAALVHFAPVGGATYLGIAQGARDHVVGAATERSRGASPLAELERVQRQAGLMDAKLQVAWWALMGSLDQIGDAYGADDGTVATVMQAKRHAVLEAIEVVDLAMETLGGRSYFRRSPLERALRDVRAGTFHPLTPENTLTFAGRHALGQPNAGE